MRAYHIIGGQPLRGHISIHGAKNSVLPILSATLLCRSPCTLHNCPNISDVDTALEILRAYGCKVTRSGTDITVDASDAHTADILPALAGKMRAAVLFLGATLARFGSAQTALPGGCPLGARPIDLHLTGFERLGASCRQVDDRIVCTATALRACTIALPFPSVGATENLMLAALGAQGQTVLCNAAREPEIVDLADFLRACGAQISGAGTSVIRISGAACLHGAEFTVMPDRMEAATYLAAAAATSGTLTLRGVRCDHLRAVLDVLHRAGCTLQRSGDCLTLSCAELCACSPISTAPYDGFPTDAQAPIMALMATAKGVTVMEETVFSDRFMHVPALRAMGADICAGRTCAVVRGVASLHGAQVEATDLRGGAAMVVAALGAQGESRITRPEHIQRGYADFVDTLRSCGAQINLTE